MLSQPSCWTLFLGGRLYSLDEHGQEDREGGHGHSVPPAVGYVHNDTYPDVRHTVARDWNKHRMIKAAAS
jgi:hypothetical protein